MDLVVDKDKQRKREKIGVAVFIGSILLIFLAVFGYLCIGHSFDLAASELDANVGSLDGYFTIVFEGNNTPIKKQEEIPDKILRKANDLLSTTNNGTEQSDIDNNAKTETASIANVSKFYQDKCSTLCRICVDDFNAYNQGEIFERKNWRLGVISVGQDAVTQADSQDASNGSEKPAIVKNVQTNINRLRETEKADLVIVLCPSDKIAKYLEKIDCVISTNVADDVPEIGKQVNSVFVMRIPEKGTIGAVTATPAKMLSAKVFDRVEIPESE